MSVKSSKLHNSETLYKGYQVNINSHIYRRTKYEKIFFSTISDVNFKNKKEIGMIEVTIKGNKNLFIQFYVKLINKQKKLLF